jgi:hypothetical protein
LQRRIPIKKKWRLTLRNESHATKDRRQSKGKKKEYIKTNEAKEDANLKEIRAGQELLKEEWKAKRT